MSFIRSPEEQVRKEAARKRVALYRDKTLDILNGVIDKVYLSNIGKMQMRAMSPLSNLQEPGQTVR
jgi:hypothetical protein